MAQRFRAKTVIGNSGLFNNIVYAPNLVYNTGVQIISGTQIYASGLISQVGITGTNLVYNTGNQTIDGIKTFSSGIISSLGVTGINLVYNTGNQNIVGIKNFTSKPKVNGVDVLLVNEVLEDILPEDILHTTGTQIISGKKIFSGVNLEFYSGANLIINGSRPTVNGTGVLLIGEVAQLPNTIVYTIGDQTISGIKTFDVRPFVNGTGVLLSGDAIANNLVYNTGNQSISGEKSFKDIVYLYSGAYFSNAGATFYNNSSQDVDIDLLSRPYTFTRLSIGDDTGVLGESINSQANFREVKIWETGGFSTQFSYGPFIRIGPAGTIISEQEGAKLGIGTKFPQEKVHISGGNLRVENDLLVSGTGIFRNRPTVNGTGVLLSGEAAQVDLSSTVRTTGDQTVSGIKYFVNNQTFSGNINVSGTGIFNAIDLNNIDNLNLSGVDVTITSGTVTLTNPTFAPNLVYNTGSQTISGVKTFENTGVFNSGIDLRNSKLINAVPDFINETNNFLISGNDNSRVILAASASQITGTIVSGNVTGFNASIIQIGAGQIQITGSGLGIIINSYNNQFRTAGQFATISLLHTGNDSYIMYGNTAL